MASYPPIDVLAGLSRLLENVLLPEVERTLAGVQEHLDRADLEEVARSRLARRV